MNELTRTWTSPHPTDIPLTLSRLAHGRNDPTHRSDGHGGVWRTTRTPAGPATMHLTQTSPTHLAATAWGVGAETALDAAPALLGWDDDPTGFRPQHPLLEQAHHRFPGLRIPTTGNVVESLIPAILEQRVVGVQAISSWHRLLTDFGTPAPGPAPTGMRVFPEPATWVSIPSWVWHQVDVDPRRSGTIVAVARVAPSLQRLTQRPPADAITALRSIRGVGEWSAAETVQRSHGDPDTISVGDYHLANLVGHHLFGRRFTDADMIQALEPWRPHRYRVILLLHALGLERAPARGPRAPLTRNRNR